MMIAGSAKIGSKLGVRFAPAPSLDMFLQMFCYESYLLTKLMILSTVKLCDQFSAMFHNRGLVCVS